MYALARDYIYHLTLIKYYGCSWLPAASVDIDKAVQPSFRADWIRPEVC